MLAINKATLGDRIVFGWTAEYARYMEARYGFARAAAINWPNYVNEAARRVEALVR